jgi:hypothetical protein
LYQTALICLQSLGSSMDVLKALGPLLEAGFTGREDKPPAIVDVFQDYWDLTFAKDSVPKGGWPSTVITCLKACGREVIMEPTSLPGETGDIAAAEEINVPMLEPAFNWGSSSTIAADDDNASDVTMTSQDSNPSVAAAQTKEVETPSTPKVAVLSVSSPQRPSKTATIRRTPFAQPTKLDYNFVMGTTSPSVTSPSRLPRSPLRSPKKTSDGPCSSDKENTPPKPAALPSLLDRIAMAASSPSTPKLGKRRASNVPTESPPKKKSRGGHVARKSNIGGGDCGGDRGADTEDDSEAECEEVRKSLLSPVTPSSAAQRHPQHAAALTAFATVPPRSLLRPCSRSPSPTPQPPQHKRKRKSVFMDAVVISRPRSAQALCSKTRSVSLHTKMGIMPTTRTRTRTLERVSLTSDEKTVLSPPPLAPLSLSLSSLSSGPVAHQNMRRAKSFSTFMSGADVPDRPPMSATPMVAQRLGKRQKVSTTPAAFLAMKTKNSKAWTAELKGNIAAARTTITSVAAAANGDDDDDGFATSASSSPISATLKRARVLFGSGKSIICPVLSVIRSTAPAPRFPPLAAFLFALHRITLLFVSHCPRGPSFCVH